MLGGATNSNVMELAKMVEQAKKLLDQNVSEMDTEQLADATQELDKKFRAFGALAAVKVAELIRIKMAGDEHQLTSSNIIAANVRLSNVSEIVGTGALMKIEDHIKGGSDCPIIEVHDIQTMAALAKILG